MYVSDDQGPTHCQPPPARSPAAPTSRRLVCIACTANASLQVAGTWTWASRARKPGSLTPGREDFDRIRRPQVKPDCVQERADEERGGQDATAQGFLGSLDKATKPHGLQCAVVVAVLCIYKVLHYSNVSSVLRTVAAKNRGLPQTRVPQGNERGSRPCRPTRSSKLEVGLED